MFSVYQRNCGVLTMAVLAGKDSESGTDYKFFLTHSTHCCVSYRNQSFDLQGKTNELILIIFSLSYLKLKFNFKFCLKAILF